MRNKRRKVAKQNATLKEQDTADRPQVFSNLRIYVRRSVARAVRQDLTLGTLQINGFTKEATLPELIKLITLHGGTYIPYLDRLSICTHIVAAVLTPSKLKEFKSYKVAKPAWLVDSVERGRLLDWRLYSVVAAGAPTESAFAFDDNAGQSQVAQRSLFGMGMAQAKGKPVSVNRAETNGVLARVAIKGEDAPAHTRSSIAPAPRATTTKRERPPPSPPLLKPAVAPKRERIVKSSPTRAYPPHSSSHQPAPPTKCAEITLSDSDEENAGGASLPPRIKKEPPAPTPTVFDRRLIPFRKVKATKDVADDYLRHYGLDPDVYHALPPSTQEAVLSDARKTTFAPLKPVARQTTLSGQSTKRSLTSAPAKAVNAVNRSKSKPRIKSSRSPSLPPARMDTAVEPSTTTKWTDEAITALGLDVDTFRELPTELQLEQMHALQAQKSLRVAAVRRGPQDSLLSNAKLRRVALRRPVRFAGQTDLEGIRAAFEDWIRASLGQEHGPDESDLERVAKFLAKCASKDKGSDLALASEVLEWWKFVLEDMCGMEGNAKGSQRLVWQGFRAVRDRTLELVEKQYGLGL